MGHHAERCLRGCAGDGGAFVMDGVVDVVVEIRIIRAKIVSMVDEIMRGINLFFPISTVLP